MSLSSALCLGRTDVTKGMSGRVSGASIGT